MMTGPMCLNVKKSLQQHVSDAGGGEQQVYLAPQIADKQISRQPLSSIIKPHHALNENSSSAMHQQHYNQTL